MIQDERKVAIVYATKHGTTEKVAQHIATLLGGDVTLISLEETRMPDLAAFDCIVIGGSIYAGKIRGKVATFCARNLSILLQKRVALYVCGMNYKEYDAELRSAFLDQLRKHAAWSGVVGGEFYIDRMNFFERFLIRKISGVTASVSKLDYEKIEELVAAIRSC
ncbi:flavodoxin domain-containing protein [uncultured Acetobacteroides sp.]|uniref:flavodoxin domain-containing protein n=1 Tax=uncultured Acetobacteroides sp. TaxID=1760811 RepID=UPI0029F46934|nr:flavodoxin domain-containing protein [uncultured Acetobacteroides sp.]